MNLAWLQEQKRMTPGMDGRYLRTLEDIETWWNLEQLKFRAQMRAQKIEGGKDRRGKNRGKKNFTLARMWALTLARKCALTLAHIRAPTLAPTWSSNLELQLELISEFKLELEACAHVDVKQCKTVHLSSKSSYKKGNYCCAKKI